MIDRAAERRELRRMLRSRRDALSPGYRRRAARSIALHVARQPWLRPGRNIALYQSTGSEIATTALYALARARNCRLYLPAIIDYRQRQMEMAAFDSGPLRPNRYGIVEPARRTLLLPVACDVVFVPLLGFDAARHRLGYGAGFYDRWLARCDAIRTLKVGIGFDLARLPLLATLSTDVALDVIITESGVH
jgi:5-formyltetrahydrofolate cyclo-ligase